MTAPFLLGLLVGGGALATLLIPRLRTATEAARIAQEAEKAARLLSAERKSAHERQLADLRVATEEKIALLSGNREQFAQQMKAISSDTLRQVSDHVEKLATAQRESDRATAAGELGKRSEEIKRSLDPIAQNLKRVSDEVARLEQDRRTTHGQTRQMFETMSAELGSPAQRDRDAGVGPEAPAGPRGVGRDAAAQLRRRREHDRARRLRLPGERDELRRQPAAPRSRRAPAGRAGRGGGREGADGGVSPRARHGGRGRAAGSCCGSTAARPGSTSTRWRPRATTHSSTRRRSSW